MAFSLGSPAAAPAFGTTPQPAFSFGSTPANTPAPGTFGTTPAPAFGAPAASAAPAFGTAPAPAFGAAPAPAFGAAPAPAFGTAPAPAFGFGSPAPAASAPLGTPVAAPVASAAPPSATTISGSTHYSQLTPDMKQAFDNMHTSIMRHKRTMLNLETMGPNLLQGKSPAITISLKKLEASIRSLQRGLQKLRVDLKTQYEVSEKVVVQSTMYAQWPVEALAHRKGVRLSTTQEEKKNDDSDLQTKIREALERSRSSVDSIEQMPSPFYWEFLSDLEQRTSTVSQQATALQKQLEESRTLVTLACSNDAVAAIGDTIEIQHVKLARVSRQLDHLHEEMDKVRYRYSTYERGENVLETAKMAELKRQTKLQEEALMHFVQATEATSSLTTPSVGAPAQPNTFSFGSATATTTPAPGGFFGQSAGGGGLFGNTTASPAPAAGGLFAASTAPAGGGLFGGGTPATAPTFGATTPAPSFGAPAAPAFGAPAFGATSSTSTTSKKKPGSSRSSRLRR